MACHCPDCGRVVDCGEVYCPLCEAGIGCDMPVPKRLEDDTNG